MVTVSHPYSNMFWNSHETIVPVVVYIAGTVPSTDWDVELPPAVIVR
jgi:Ni,Fe-hydrogenase III small subunit